MRDILFDEKIAGSFHLTPGNAYDEADNGNRSKIHWDLVQIQRPDYGGGTIASTASRSAWTGCSFPRISGASILRRNHDPAYICTFAKPGRVPKRNGISLR